jgi:glycosyltransferase involved in cell wall biosynthesis
MTKTAMLINFGTHFPLQRDSISRLMFGLAKDTGRYTKCVAFIAADNTPFVFRGVQAYPFTENRLVNRVANKWFRMGAFTWQDLVKRINATRPDILHFQNKQWLIAPILKRLDYRPKIVVHYHLFGETIIPKGTDLCLVVSRSMVDYLEKTNLDDVPVKVLYNFVFSTAPSEAEEQRFDQARPISILFGGGDGRHKGIHELIEAVQGIDDDELAVSIAGRGTDRLNISDPRLRPLGLLSGNQYEQLLHDADIVVMPSRIEPFGLVAIEALAAGKLLVHTAVDGLGEFANSECSLVVRPRDAESLRDGLVRAIRLIRTEPETVRRLTDNARAVAAQYSVDRTVTELEDMYDELFSA